MGRPLHGPERPPDRRTAVAGSTGEGVPILCSVALFLCALVFYCTIKGEGLQTGENISCGHSLSHVYAIKKAAHLNVVRGLLGED